MKKGDRRRLERLFDGRATLEEELALERDASDDAAHDAQLAGGLARVRALLAACEALPQPAHERLDVEALVAKVRASLEHPAAEVPATLADTAALAGPTPSVWRRRRAWSSLAAVLVCAAGLGIYFDINVRGRATIERGPGAPARELLPGRHASVTGSVLEQVPLEQGPIDGPEADRAAHAEARQSDADQRAARPWAMPGAPLPSAPVDGVRRDAALAALGDVLTRADVRGDLEVVALGDGAAFASRADAAFASEVDGLWPLASLAEALLEHDDPDVAAPAARYVAARRDALTAGRIARALDRELAADVDERQCVRLAAAQALAELGAFDALARRFDDLCEAGARGEARDLEALLGAWSTAGREDLALELARAFPRSWRPRSAAALAHLGALGRPGADTLARLALDGTTRNTAAQWDSRRGTHPSDLTAEALELLTASPYGASAVEDLVRTERSPSGARLERLCALIEGTASLGALDWLTALARKGEPRALVSLARLPGAEPVATLVELDAEGFVRDDHVWRELVSLDAGRVASYVTKVAGIHAGDAERVVTCMIACGAIEAAPVLAAAAGEPWLGVRTRERAALALAHLEASQLGSADVAALCLVLDAALAREWRASSDDGLVAALVVACATWLGPEPLARTLVSCGALAVERVARAATPSRSADSALARQARVERTLATARVAARVTLRGNRGTELR